MARIARFIRPLLVLVLFLGVLAPVAFATDAYLVGDASLFDVKLPTAVPSRVGLTLAFDGNAIQLRMVARGKGTLPDINLAMAGPEVPRTKIGDKVNLTAALEECTKVQRVPGGVVVEHRNTNLQALRTRYTNAFADLGFVFDRSASDCRCWHFTGASGTVRVNATSAGKNVVAYIGR